MLWFATLSIPGFGDIWDDANAARKRGDFPTYIKILRGMAEQGNAKAKVNLGALYLQGKGVSQDFAEAYFWLILATRQIRTFFAERDEAASKLSPARQQEVHERCKKWLEDLEKRRQAGEAPANGGQRWPEKNEQCE